MEEWDGGEASGVKAEANGRDGAADMYAGRVDATRRSEPVDEICRRLNARRLAFQYAGQASLVVEAASAVYRDPCDETKPATMLMVVPAVPDALRRPVEQVSTWQRHDERKGRLVAKPVPDWVLRQVVAERGAGLPSLLGVADHPVFHNGQLIGGHLGFHPPTNLYIHSDVIREHRWPDPVDAARFLAGNWLGRFPFREAGDLERALLLPLTLLTRRTMIRGGAPLFFITSPEARSGKSLLARCAILAVTGMTPATVPFKSNSEEFNKTFDAAVLEGQTTIFLNNAPNGWRVGTAELDAYADSDEYSPRILGVSSKRTVPALAVVVVCGNNIVAAGDTTTRVLEVRLERKKDEAGLVAALDFTAANRPKILSALAEVLRHTAPPVPAESRFPAWEGIVARPLMGLLGASTTLQGIAEAVSGSAANPDYEDFILRLADLADDREHAALLDEDREPARWLPAVDLIADPGCSEALSQLLTRKGVPPVLRPNNLPTQLAPSRIRPPAAIVCASARGPRRPKTPAKGAETALPSTSPQSQPIENAQKTAGPQEPQRDPSYSKFGSPCQNPA